jgi:16S rRNA (guanine(966)-N(2))-methyltransferase RsmD
VSPRIDDESRWLDLCAGTGAVGIEALSRGAGFVTFVDKSRRACALIEENLDLLKISEEQTEVHALSAENFVSRKHEIGWDIVFFDPPYDSNYALVLSEVGADRPDLLREGGILMAEHYRKNELPDRIGQIRRWRIVTQGSTCISFYERD